MTIGNYLRMVKFSHTIFAMPFAIIGIVLALQNHTPPLEEIILKVVLILVCMITARNAAMGFNRYIDREFDKRNPRTANREIPAGVISPNKARLFVIVNCVIFIIATYFINEICLILSPIALGVVLFYSYTKRFTALCHFVLSLGLSLAPIGAWLAIVGEFAVTPVLFSLITLFWVSGFDIIYACQDSGFDKSEKLHSIPVLLGVKRALNLSILLHIITTIITIYIGIYLDMHSIYWLGVAIFIAINIYQQSIAQRDINGIGPIFGMVNGIASVLFSIFTILAIYM